jgi:outer membrane biosynthesis protein TonB
MKKMKTLRSAYNKAVTVEPKLMGKITVKFAINEYGHIIFAEIADSDIAIKEPQLCNEFLRIIRLWKFDRIKKKGDITESDILVF